MRTAALIITKEIRNELRRVQEFAAMNIIDQDRLESIRRGELPPPGDQEGFIVYIPRGFRVVYSMEVQPDPLGLCHHLSVSLEQGAHLEKYPHPAAVEAIMNEIGFEGGIKHCVAYLEEENFSANIIQPVGKAISKEVLEGVVLDPGINSKPIGVTAREEENGPDSGS
jgi:hypothetical protein